jgi:hypothetical protein
MREKPQLRRVSARRNVGRNGCHSKSRGSCRSFRTDYIVPTTWSKSEWEPIHTHVIVSPSRRPTARQPIPYPHGVQGFGRMDSFEMQAWMRPVLPPELVVLFRFRFNVFRQPDEHLPEIISDERLHNSSIPASRTRPARTSSRAFAASRASCDCDRLKASSHFRSSAISSKMIAAIASCFDSGNAFSAVIASFNARVISYVLRLYFCQLPTCGRPADLPTKYTACNVYSPADLSQSFTQTTTCVAAHYKVH